MFNFNDLDPTCDKECKFKVTGSHTTLVGFIPIYDKNGVNTNPDGNVTTQYISCQTCKKNWITKTQYDKTTFRQCNTLN